MSVNPRRAYKQAWRDANREMVRATGRRYYARNRDRFRVWQRKSRIKNAEKIRESERKYIAANREKYLARRRRYRQLNKIGIRAYMKEWRAKNKEHSKRYHAQRIVAWNAKRRALKRLVTIGDLSAIEKIYDRARHLRKWFDVVVDHIIPLSKDGIHCASNLQIIYRFENSLKGSSLDYKPKVIFA